MIKVKEMTDVELKKAWDRGVAWLNKKSQSWGNKKEAVDGTPYDHGKFLLGLGRLESIEDESRNREIKL